MLHNMSVGEMIWVAIGLGGQICFGGRFLLQWLQSEREGKSVIPIGFWYMSIIGSVVLFVYALHKLDPVFILGQASGVFIYVRNLHLIYRERRNLAVQHSSNVASVEPEPKAVSKLT